MILKPITREGFAAFFDSTIQGFAEECVDVGRWVAAEALEHSKTIIEADLPQGIDTPNHYFFQLYDHVNQTEIGYVWLEIMSKDNLPTLFINDIEVSAKYRRKGHASEAFQLVEKFAAEHDISRVALHVFRTNTAAQALYKKLGFNVTGLNLLKNL